MPPQIGVRRKIYDIEERKCIDKFKEDYMNTTTPSERKSLAQNQIFPELFTYWSSIGVDINADEKNKRSEVRSKNVKRFRLLRFIIDKILLRWLRNVWRIRKTPVGKPGGRYRLTDILWWTKQKDVFQEIASILGLDNADTKTPGWFQLRTKASKNIINSMTQEDRNNLENEADRMQKEGLPQDVQRRLVNDHGRLAPISCRCLLILNLNLQNRGG